MPLPEAVRKALESVTLDDKYALGPDAFERSAGAGAPADATESATRPSASTPPAL
jgi:hypothetical protein